MTKKKYAAEVQEPQEVAQAQTEPLATAEELTAPKSNSPIQAKPLVYLEDEQGVQYQFTRFPLPKRAQKNPDGEFKVVIDGQEYPVWTTASRGWAADDAVIEYIWLQLPEDTTGYITLDYNVLAANFNDVVFKLGTGKANRENPQRVPKDLAKEENRKAQALATLAKNKEAAATEAPAETPQDQ